MAHLNAISFPSIEELREYAIRPATKFACIFRCGIKGTRADAEVSRVPKERESDRLLDEGWLYFFHRYPTTSILIPI